MICNLSFQHCFYSGSRVQTAAGRGDGAQGQLGKLKPAHYPSENALREVSGAPHKARVDAHFFKSKIVQ